MRFIRHLILILLTLTAGITMVNAKEVGLSIKEQQLVPISALVATGKLSDSDHAFTAALDSGVTINEINEALVHLYAYAGFPRSLNGLAKFKTILDERTKKGIKDKQGRSATPIGKDVDLLKEGTKVQTKLVGRPVSGGLMDFAPAVDQYLKEHLFGAIFARDTLTHKEREVVTIAALAAMEGTESQLGAHIMIGQNAGLSKEEIKQIISLLENIIGKDRVANSLKLLN